MHLKDLLRVFLIAFCCFLVAPAMAQNKTVTGKVTDTKDGQPLPGVAVVASGSSIGTTTDINGIFKLSVPATATSLTFTFVGYTKKDVPITGTVVNTTLESSNTALNEVIVVGYGTVRKKDATGAVTQVTSADFVQGVTTNPLQQLQGKAAGVVVTTTSGDPNGSPTVRIRGTASLSGGNDPLYVIDGVAGADIRSVSPNDIESFNIEKDASAAAIYGSRAAGGVILITTKQGKAGKPQVSYNTYVATESAQHLIKFMNRDQYLAAAKNQQLDLSKADQGANTDWFNEILRTGFTQSHNLSVGGGTELSHYRGSVTYINQQGIAATSGRKSINGRFNFDQKALDNKLTISMGLAADHANANYIDSSAFLFAATAPPINNIYNADGSLQRLIGTDLSNPVSHIKDITNNGILGQTVGNIKLDYLLVKGLTASAYANGSKINNTTNLFLPTTSVANVVDRQGRTLNATGLGDVSRGTNTTTQGTYGFTGNYKLNFGKSRLSVLGGYEYNTFNYTSQTVAAHDFDGTNLPDINLSAANIVTHGVDLYSFNNGYILRSIFGRAEYIYDDRFYFTANVRNDASTKLGINNQNGLFPSFSAAWALSNEQFMKGVTWISNLKLRGGYGKIGNQGAITPLGSQSLYGSTGTPYFDLSTGTWRTSNGPIQNPNADLRWEIKTTVNAGVDFSLFGGRLNGSIDVYNQNTNHLLYTYQVPVGGQYNFSTILANVGKLNNKGIEVALDGTIVKSDGGFSWKSGINVSINRNKIVNLTGSFNGSSLHTDSVVVGTTAGTGISGAASQIGYIKVGMPIGTLLLAQYAGINADGQQQYYHYAADGTRSVVLQDGVVQSDKRFYSTQAKFTYGFSNNFSYNRFDLSVFMRGQYGGKGFNETYMDYTSLAKVGTYNVIADAAKLGIKSSSFPSTYWLQSTSYLKIQSATLGYTFGIKDNKYLSMFKIYAAGNNLYTFTKYKGVDPELVTAGNQTGIDTRSLYPRSRQLSFGVNITLK